MAEVLLQDLAHSYRLQPGQAQDYAVRPLNMTWRDGGAYALLGPSGCGKTTLLNIISGLIQPTQGKVFFDGQDVTQLPTERRNIAQVFQFPVIYDTMTVFDNLAFPLRNRGASGAEVNRRVQEVAEQLELSADLKRRASGLSADIKQKISLGRGLVRSDVAAILFDEPLTVIDPQLKLVLRSKLKQIHRQFNLTLIYVTHDQTEALTFAEQVVVMYEGSVVQVGTPQELFEAPAHTFVGYFIGSPGMNLLPAQLIGGRIFIGVAPLPLDSSGLRLAAGDELAVGIRPEFVECRPASAGPADAAVPGVSLAAQIERIEDLGAYRIVTARLDGSGPEQIVKARLDESAPVALGAAWLYFPLARLRVYQNGKAL